MHQLSVLIAIEPDQLSASKLRKNLDQNLQQRLLYHVHEKTSHQLLEIGLQQSFDVVTIFRVLYYISADARRQLIGNIYNSLLKPGGLVIVLHTTHHSAPDSVMKIVSALSPSNESACLSADEIQSDMTDVGFRVIGKHEFNCGYDLSDADQQLADFFADWIGHSVTVQQLRELVQNIWPDGSYRNHYALMWFEK